MYQIGSFINGKLIKGSSNNTLPVYNPSTGEIQSEVILTNKDDFQKSFRVFPSAVQPTARCTHQQHVFVQRKACKASMLADVASTWRHRRRREEGDATRERTRESQRSAQWSNSPAALLQLFCGLAHGL